MQTKRKGRAGETARMEKSIESIRLRWHPQLQPRLHGSSLNLDVHGAPGFPQLPDQIDEIVSRAPCPNSYRGVVLYFDEIRDFDFIYSASANAVSKSIEIATMPARGSYGLEERIINVVLSCPVLAVHDDLSHREPHARSQLCLPLRFLTVTSPGEQSTQPGVAVLRAIVRRGCKRSAQLARVKQREWKKHRVDTIEAAPAIAAPGLHPGLFSAAPIRSELPAPLTGRGLEEVKEVKEVKETEKV
jgi:hypothetical protein